MKSHGINLKVHFPGLEKSRIFRKLAKVMEKSWNFIFRSKHFVLFLKLETITLSSSKNIAKKTGFSAFFSHGKLKLVMEKSLNLIAQILCQSCHNSSHLFLSGQGGGVRSKSALTV